MKGGKDEERVTGPLFPSLHVNDAEKGGPRAPPRNKMALYEQLSIPSQRFSSGSASMLPLPPNNGSSLVPSTSSSYMKGTATTGLKSRQLVGNQSEGNPEVPQSSEDPTQWLISIPSTGDKLLADASSSSSTRDKNLESYKRAHGSSNKENISSFVDDISRLHGTNTQLHQECVTMRENMPLRDSVLVEPLKGVGMGNASMMRGKLCSKSSLGHDHRRPNVLENGDCRGGKECESLQVVDVNRNENDSDTSMVDSISALDISPDDVVGVIGEKQFWKARRAIVKEGSHLPAVFTS